MNGNDSIIIPKKRSSWLRKNFFTRKNFGKIKVLERQWVAWKKRPLRITEIANDGITCLKSQGYSEEENDKTSVLSLLEYLKEQGTK